jgi:hypothetical protein
VQHPLRWIQTSHDHVYDVLLDAAAYVPSNRLDLSVVKPDFVPISGYKVLGYPTGVVCLIALREALARLRLPWVAGRSVYMASVLADWHTLAADEARFEDGTPSFQQIPDLEFGLAWISRIGIDRIHQRVTCLTGWLLDRLEALRHCNGEPAARTYRPASTRGRAASCLQPADPAAASWRARGRAGYAAAGSRTYRVLLQLASSKVFQLPRPTGAHGRAGLASSPARHAQRRGAALIGGLGLHRLRRGTVPGLRGADVPGSRDRHRRPATPAGLLSHRR